LFDRAAVAGISVDSIGNQPNFMTLETTMRGSNTERDDLLARLGERWGLLATNVNGRDLYQLEIDGRFDVALFQTGGTVMIEASLGPLPSGDDRAWDRLLELLGTYLGELRTREEVLSLTLDSRDLILFRRLSRSGLTLDRLEVALEAFVNQLELWTERLTEEPRMKTPAMPYFLFP
jgi:hypothetical protein